MKDNRITKQRLLRYLLITLIAFALMHLFSSCRKSNYQIADHSVVVNDLGGGTGTLTWKKSKEYILEGFVFVNDGQTLTIEAGTVIRAREGSGAAASALIVARGGKLIAQGTPEEPIIFTSAKDPLDGSLDPKENRGLWGGVIILGHAPLNLESIESHIEGIPIAESRALFGGHSPEDNSGIMTYVSIRYGGTRLQDGNEINGLTLGGVGSGTQLNHIEVIANEDDGFEFFGGTVNAKNLVASFCSDDAFDIDMGYQGKLQFLLGIQNAGNGGALLEVSGDQNLNLPAFNSKLQIANATFIGRGLYQKTTALDLRNNIEGFFVNSIIVNQQSGAWVLQNTHVQNAFAQLQNEQLEIANNVFFDLGDLHPLKLIIPDGSASEEKQIWLNSYFTNHGNTVENPEIEWGEQKQLFPQNIEINKNPYELTDPWFDQVNFKGAFGTYNWCDSWSLADQLDYIGG